MTVPPLPDLIRLGIPEMDGEHAVQLQLLRSLEDALANADRDSAATLMVQLEDFTKAHFLAEQILMRLNAYPGILSHHLEHDRLIEELAALRAAIESKGVIESEVTPLSIEAWLLRHIQTADRAFARYLAVTRGDLPAAPSTAAE